MASRRQEDHYSVNSHLVPFLPYVEKSSTSELGEPWRWPGSRSEPIKVDTLKTWLDTCDTNHGSHCRGQETAGEDQRPLWLVNVRRQCIVRAEAGLSYVALSYVWGQADCVSLAEENLDMLMKEG